MTAKEFHKLSKWMREDKRAKLEGYFMLYPSSIKFMNEPSDYIQETVEKGQDIFISPWGNEKPSYILGEYFFFPNSTSYKKFFIHYKHVKRARIYNYNN